jgi:hypothetical protein
MMFAAGAEIPYVMAQVGHDDSKVTLEIYARVLKRRDRDQIGQAFDRLLVGGSSVAAGSSDGASGDPDQSLETSSPAGRTLS